MSEAPEQDKAGKAISYLREHIRYGARIDRAEVPLAAVDILEDIVERLTHIEKMLGANAEADEWADRVRVRAQASRRRGV